MLANSVAAAAGAAAAIAIAATIELEADDSNKWLISDIRIG